MSGTELELPETMDANPAPEDDVPGDRPLSPREQIMAGIAAKREAQIAADNAQAAIYDREASEAGLNFETDETERNLEPEPRTPPLSASQREAVTPSVPAPVVPAVRTIVLNGQQVYVDEAQYEHLAQLGMHANIALHQFQQPPQTVAEPEQPRPLIDEARIAETVRQMQYGGEAAATEALRDLITDVVSRSAPAPFDPNVLVSQAVTVAEQRRRLADDTATIQAEYPDIFADVQRTMLAKLNVDAIRQRDIATGRSRSDLEIYREAGDAVYTALGKSRPGIQENTQPALQAASGNIVPIRQDVIERKRAAPRNTTPIDMRSPAPAPQRAPSPSDIVERMRASRGQASMR